MMNSLKRCIPKFKTYLWIASLMTAVWLGFVGYMVEQAITEGREITGLMKGTLQGTAAIVALLGVVFSLHWTGKAIAQGLDAKDTRQLEHYQQQIEEADRARRTFSLEIKAAGLAIDKHQQSTLWKKIKQKNDNFASIYSQDPKDYSNSADRRWTDADINIRAAARHSARDAVAYWPVPSFALAPPKQPNDKNDRAAGGISSARNGATLGVNLFLWQDAENTTHAQRILQKLFQFFDNNSEVPEAFVFSEDGDSTRSGYRVPGTPGLSDGYYLPKTLDSMTGLLVARTDRVDRYLRPYAVRQQEDNQDKSTDLGKLWFFYWDRDRKFDRLYELEKHAEGVAEPLSPSTMSSDYWHAQLPEFWKTISNRGPGDFRPTKWLPIRWAKHQIEEYDETPTLGYLHRPVKVPMVDERGQPLKPALRARALQSAWQQALDTLPDGEKPQRVFYDTTDGLEVEITLTQALHALNTDGNGLDLNNVNEAFDIGRRLGNTGVSSALVEINLATIASYFDGGISAVFYTGTDGSFTVQMIRPPSDATKAKNAKTRWDDPFKFGAPGGVQ
ncbi:MULTISPECIES: DUF2875 family protein [unclassified Pseudomonas]|uniref:type VI lipase adapter Tla3 domain-containing protein n=1 Tax=unclassified Pseudomonas TaxID=196821 RepID=UPI000D3B2F61|nr:MULTISPECIES: DUF2875 family protein [unclassified Pseudomonas]RAU39514.1 DUF2875 domain-containing protein [Pseudomonas sp. RIT 409]RAU55106.1 DUF2875 domain-containing protein [Pseudomonas sp. RIT 412]